MDNSNLADYIRESRSHGKTDAEIKAALLSAGWPEAMVNQQLTPTPGIQPQGNITMAPAYHPDFGMWVVFEYVLMFISLATTATSLAGLIHHFINTQVPPKHSSIYGAYFSIDSYLVISYLAALIVSFPIFAYLALKLRARLEKYPEIRKIKVRKVFIYIALTWTFMVLLTRFIRTVYSFLSGDVVILNVLSHLAVTVLISGAIFLYFVIEINQDQKS
jgi:hypothetical protein